MDTLTAASLLDSKEHALLAMTDSCWLRRRFTGTYTALAVLMDEVDAMNEHFDKIASYLKMRSRLSFAGHKRSVLRHRLEARLEQLQLPDFSAYWELLCSNPAEEEALFELATTNETSFFRNQGQFAYLKESIIPLIGNRLSQEGGTIRILSAGCSTGEEPYSIAMTALAALGDPGNIRLEIVAGDLSENCLRVARTGSYETGRLKSLPPAYQERFMTSAAGVATMKAEVKGIVRFIRLNLDELITSDCPSWNKGLGLFDIIFCRNVMIYFDSPSQQKLVDTLYQLLLPDGFLFTGDAEPLHLFSHEFKPVAEAGCLIYQKRSD